ncbi:hypothetical protein SNEBB_001196 [Seison nebaliae]|nr:hypothetical protein SNEBB_001196 [Seison nebaliae]
MRNTKKKIKLVRKRIRTGIWRRVKRSIESSSCDLSSEVTAKEAAETKEWTREGGISVVKKNLRGMTEGQSIFIFWRKVAEVIGKKKWSI